MKRALVLASVASMIDQFNMPNIRLMKEMGYGRDYKYSHNYPGNFVQQQFMPDELGHPTLWNACDNPSEAKMKALNDQRWGK
jgi:putative ATPase